MRLTAAARANSSLDDRRWTDPGSVIHAGWAAKNFQMVSVALSSCDVGSRFSRKVVPPGHWCLPPSMVINSTVRLSAHAAVDVVSGALVVTLGGPHWSTLRHNALTSGTGGPLTALATVP